MVGMAVARMKNYLKGRKNFIFCGNHQSAAYTAIICSLLASCEGVGINPREWLNDVIAKLPDYCRHGKTKNLKELLPAYV